MLDLAEEMLDGSSDRANSLAEKVSKERGEKVTAYFLNVKGPELLNKYAGETERKIREVFQ